MYTYRPARDVRRLLAMPEQGRHHVKLQSALTTLAAGVLSLALVAPAAAAVDVSTDAAQPTIAPSGPGDNGKPDNTGRPEEPGQPGGAGATDGDFNGRGIPELPENASPQAEAAVQATYERFAAISARIDAIRDIEPGPERNAALNELFADFSEMIHTVSDVVHEADGEGAQDGDDSDPEDVELVLEGEEDADTDDSDADADDADADGRDGDETDAVDGDHDDDDRDRRERDRDGGAEDDGDHDDDQDKKKDADDED